MDGWAVVLDAARGSCDYSICSRWAGRECVGVGGAEVRGRSGDIFWLLFRAFNYRLRGS